MAEDKTLLAHLAPMLGSSTENIAVEALGHVLSTSEAALRAIEDVLKTGGAEVGTISHVRTQDSDEKGRPDLSIRDEHNNERVLIEAKFWAGLTERQPVTYLERLPIDKPSALLFVAPDARFESLWTELRRRVVDGGMDLGTASKDANLRSAKVGDGCRLMLTSWKFLLDRMASRARGASDSRAACDIQQLRGLTQNEDNEAFLPLRVEELHPEFPRRVLALGRLVRDVATRASQEEWANWTGQQPSIGEAYCGWYMLLAGAPVWFGYWCAPWAQHRDTPLWLEFSESSDDKCPTVTFTEVRHRLAPLQKEVPPGIIDTHEGRRVLVPINLPVGVEYDTVLDAVAKRLEYIAGLIDSPDTTS